MKNEDTISLNFTRDEFACQCGCGFDTVDVGLIRALQKARHAFGPIRVTSGCRCPEHNEKVGGSAKSQHLRGRAADIQIEGVSPAEVAHWFRTNTNCSVGQYRNWVHVDSRSNTIAYWYGKDVLEPK